MILKNTARRQELLAWGYLAAIVWVNAYVCRQIFFIEYTGQFHSMHGYWIAISRLAEEHWWQPSWWPYWFGGMPFEFTYAPLVPGLTSLVAKCSGLSAARVLNIIFGLVFCLGPAALFWMAWQITRRPGWSFVAGLAYSLFAPTELLLPDGKFDFQHFLDARRLYLSFIWDEVPHQLALALVCLAVVLFVRAVGSGGRTAAPWAVVLAASAMLANAFGGTTLVMVLACLLVTVDEGKPRRNFLIAVCTGVFAYLLVSPFLPPSLLGAIRANAELYPESAWTWSSLGGLLAVVFGGIVLGAVSRTWRPWYLRFFLLLAYVMTAIPALHQLRDVHFIPQAGRYKVEMELALVLLLVFAAALVVDRLPKAVRIALAVALIWPAAGQLISIRRFSKRVLKPVNIAGTIEFRTAQWLQNNLPGQRVMAPGSIALWMNAFSEVPQFTGGSYPTAPSSVPQRILWELFPGIEDATGRVAATVAWLKAYGVDALIVPGPKSPEFWKPFRNPQHFDQSLQLLWRERDTSIYRVPRIRRGLVHVVPEAATVKQPPRGIGDLDLIARYTAALDDPGGISAVTTWTRDSRARIRANMPSGYVLSVQMTYHPGWKARANGNPVPIERDGLDQMVLKPACNGPCEVDLSYAGGWESWLCRAASLLTLMAGCVTVLGKIRGHRGLGVLGTTRRFAIRCLSRGAKNL